MFTFRVSAAAAVVGAILSLTGQVSAMGLGRASQRAVLGENLAMSVPVRLESGEDLSSECVAADVFFGDDKLTPQQVSVSLEGSGTERTLRIASRSVINEPVVSVYAVVGCQSRISRKFVVFADPPTLAIAPDDALDVMAAPSPVSARATARNKPKASAAEPGASRPGVVADPSGMKVSDGRPSPDQRKAQVDRPLPSLKTSNPSSSRKVSAAPAVAAARLVLDPVEADAMVVPGLQWSMGMQAPVDSPEVIQRRAAAAALWTALNATPEQQQKDRLRLDELQGRLTQMQQDLSVARSRIAQAEAATPSTERVLRHPLVLGLSLLALVLAAGLIWLWRRSVSAARDTDWWRDGVEPAEPDAVAATPHEGADPSQDQAPTLPSPLSATPRQPAYPSGHARALTAGAAALAGTSTGASAPTSVPSSGAPGSPVNPLAFSQATAQEAPRELSVEELIDLEQQAEFFVVLGQDDAAIELLESHVQSAGAVSPLPYLKLLELYRRLDRRDDYERSREVFNARFNAYAPSWDADLQHGHHLEDYAGVIGRLEGLWSRPAKAMEVIGASLLRADESNETFDLPAYRELLFLYSVARDLAERPHVRPDDAPPSTFQELEPLMATRPVRASPQALPPLNLDLSLDEPAPEASDGPDHPSTEAVDTSSPHVIEFENVGFKRPEH